MTARIAFLLLLGLLAHAQAPLAKPLADFDQLVSQLKTNRITAAPISAGSSTVIPFAAIQFGWGGGALSVAQAGGMSLESVPLGVLIVEGDDVRVESLPPSGEKPGVVQQLLQAILDRKVIVMGNGLNIGHASGTVQDLAPVLSGMMGQTIIVGNALNFGKLEKPPKEAAATSHKPQ